jgi:hypothetical protein
MHKLVTVWRETFESGNTVISSDIWQFRRQQMAHSKSRSIELTSIRKLPEISVCGPASTEVEETNAIAQSFYIGRWQHISDM